MPRESANITLTPDEVIEFIAKQAMCVVATLDPDGSPWGDVAPCVFRDGRLYFRVAETSRSRRNIEADPRVCCTLEARGQGYYAMATTMLHGVAVPLGEGAPIAELDALPDPATGAPVVGPVFSVDLGNVVSFDFGKIQRRFEQE